MNTVPRLLLVEDDPSLQRMYDLAFTKSGFSVTTSPDGTIVAETASVNPPDIIVLDFMMPNYDGLLALKELKSNIRTRGIPVIMLSANNDQKVIDEALQLGANQYLVKGNQEIHEIVAILKQTLAFSKQ